MHMLPTSLIEKRLNKVGDNMACKGKSKSKSKGKGKGGK